MFGKRKQLQLNWLTLCMTVTSGIVFAGTPSFSWRGVFGLSLCNVLVYSFVERILYQVAGFRFNMKHAVLLLSAGGVYGVGLRLQYQLFSSMYGMIGLGLVFALICIWSVSEWMRPLNAVKICGLVLFFLALCSAVILFWKNFGVFSLDSYSYYEIATTIGENFGAVSTIRQYVIDTEYNISFPYFYPLCIWIMDKFTGIGHYAGILVNYYVAILTAVLLLFVSKMFVNRLWCGGVAIVLLCTTSSYIEEVAMARSIPLAILCMVILFATLGYCCLSNDQKVHIFYYWVLGIGAGILVSTRFDGMIAVGYFAFLILLFSRKHLISEGLYLAGCLLTASLWIIYSIVRVGKIWVSDNSGTAFLVESSVPSRVYTPKESETLLTLLNAPKLWFISRIQNFLNNLRGLLSCNYISTILVCVCVVYLLYRLASGKMARNNVVLSLVIMLFYTGKFAMYVIVGYSDIRYHAEAAIVGVFTILIVCAREQLKLKKTAVVALSISLAGGMYAQFGDAIIPPQNWAILSSVEVAPQRVVQLEQDLEGYLSESTPILMLDFYIDFSGWSNRIVYVPPAVPTWENLQYILKQKNIQYVVIAKDTKYPEILSELQKRGNCFELSAFYLFTVS